MLFKFVVYLAISWLFQLGATGQANVHASHTQGVSLKTHASYTQGVELKRNCDHCARDFQNNGGCGLDKKEAEGKIGIGCESCDYDRYCNGNFGIQKKQQGGINEPFETKIQDCDAYFHLYNWKGCYGPWTRKEDWVQCVSADHATKSLADNIRGKMRQTGCNLMVGASVARLGGVNLETSGCGTIKCVLEKANISLKSGRAIPIYRNCPSCYGQIPYIIKGFETKGSLIPINAFHIAVGAIGTLAILSGAYWLRSKQTTESEFTQLLQQSDIDV